MNMNKIELESSLDKIKWSTDKRIVLKELFKLRSLVSDNEGITLFRENGGIPIMIRFLKRPYKNILEISLSILANCCIESKSVDLALKFNIIPPTVTILKSIPNQLIQTRACRLLGNLSKYDNEGTLQTDLVACMAQSLISIMRDIESTDTRICALRACKYMLPSLKFLKEFLLQKGLYLLLSIFDKLMQNDTINNESEVSNTFDKKADDKASKQSYHPWKIHHAQLSDTDNLHNELLIYDEQIMRDFNIKTSLYVMPTERSVLILIVEILKCLMAISKTAAFDQELRSSVVMNCECSFRPLIFLITPNNKYRSYALHILSNFAKKSCFYSFIDDTDALLAICKLLTSENMETPLEDCELSYCIKVMNLLAIDSCNRLKIRRTGTIIKLVNILRESQVNYIDCLIFPILSYFEYDDLSMSVMLHEGLISIMIRYLHKYLIEDDDYHKKMREEKQTSSKKRKLPIEINNLKCKRITTTCISTPIEESPSSSPNHKSPDSPCSSRSLSPNGSIFLKKVEDDENEAYSPVCSDDDDDEETEIVMQQQQNASCELVSEITTLLDKARESVELIEEETIDKNVETVESDKFENNVYQNVLDIIEILLFRATLNAQKRYELGKEETITTLIKALMVFGGQNNFSNSLTNILLESQFFQLVVKRGIVHQLYLLTISRETKKDGFGFLDTLTCVGESNYGKSHLANLLRSDDVISQRRAAIAVAYIIKSKPILRQFLNDGNALKILLSTILRCKNEIYTNEAADALTFMAKQTLEITIPYMDDKSKILEKYDTFNEADEVLNEKEPIIYDMCFQVHEGKENENNLTTRVNFNKNLLCNISEVFNKMLTGNFREGHEGEIHLKTYSVKSLKYFLNLIVRAANRMPLNCPTVDNYLNLLETLEMSRFYMIPSIEEHAHELLIRMLNENHCVDVLEWSIKNYHFELTEIAVNYFLCSNISTEAKVKLFRHANELVTDTTQWQQMICETILMRCCNGI